MASWTILAQSRKRKKMGSIPARSWRPGPGGLLASLTWSELEVHAPGEASELGIAFRERAL